MNVFSVYEIASGRLTGQRISASGDVNPDWIPDGCGVVLGEWDHESWQVDHETGTLVSVIPPAPDWRLRKWQAMDAALAEIQAAEAEQARPMREIVDAMLGQTEPASEALVRFNAITQRIKTARERLDAVRSAKTEAELDAASLRHA